VSIDAINGAGLSSRKIGKKEDFTALVIAASPTALSLADSPVLRAWTNKQSTCFYNGSGAKPTFFDYTNTTYHEAKVRKESSMTLNYTITCTDLSTNSASAYVNFTINTSRTAGSAVISGFSTFEGIITTAEINLTDSGTLLSGADNKRFNISIDGKIVDFCLFDNGNGFYNISFVAPETYGTHELKVIFDSVPFTISFEVKRLYLFASYLEAGINALNTTHITYNEFSGRRIGLATDAQRSRINISSGTNSLSLTYIPLHSSIFIFNTRKAGSINNKEKQLSEKLDLGTKSFGYDLGLKELADFILRYDEFAIASVGFNVTQKGKYNFNTIKTVTREGETQLIFSR
jgi:hypothetical protein